jgi:hypothetical protein
VLECSIRDLTPEGARLVLPADAPAAIPGKVLLLLPSLGELWAARVCWQARSAIGVEFVLGEADRRAGGAAKYPDIFALQVQVAELARGYHAANTNMLRARPRQPARAAR